MNNLIDSINLSEAATSSAITECRSHIANLRNMIEEIEAKITASYLNNLQNFIDDVKQDHESK